MKTHVLGFTLFLILSAGCKKNIITTTQINNTDTLKKVTSIDAQKNGTAFINYLGTKMEGC